MPNCRKKLTEPQIQQIEELWGAGENCSIIAFNVGISYDTLRARRKDQLSHLESRKKAYRNRYQPDPTPEQLAERMAEVRERWTPEEEMERRTDFFGYDQLQVFG